MFDLTENWKPVFYISGGATIGAWFRSYLTRNFRVLSHSWPFGTLTINLIASFALGFTLAIKSDMGKNFSSDAYFFICIGLLGSFSTFSTFIVDSLKLFEANGWRDCLDFIAISLTLGCLAAIAGLMVGNI